MELKNKRFFLLDMDGTLYLDDNLFDGTLDFLSAVRKKGGRYLFVTNNSSKGTDAYVSKLRRIGIEASSEDFLTSTNATVLYLNNNYPGNKFYTCGTKSFVKELSRCGVNITTTPDEDVFGIVLSNDQEITFKKLDDMCKLLLRDIVYIATNPDWVCPTAYGYVPDCGSFAEMLHRATGKKPIFIGKPQPEMLLLAMERFGFTKEETLMVGDRVYTDIASGYNAGVDTVLVLSGEGTVEEADASDKKPTYIFNSVKDLYEIIKQK